MKKKMAEKPAPTITTEPRKGGARIGEKDSQDFPEGGRGWFVLFGMWIVMGTTYGFINAFGDYQAHYTVTFPDTKQSVLTLIGSLQPFTVFLSSIPAVSIMNRVGARPAIALGGAIMIFAFMMISICKQVWQLFLAQGILFGLGCGLSVFVAYSLPPQWFKKRRALAVGLCASGSSLGGMLWPIAFSSLVSNVGFAWANRIIGFIYIPLVAVAVFAAEARQTDGPVEPPPPQQDMISKSDEVVEITRRDSDDIEHQIISHPAIGDVPTEKPVVVDPAKEIQPLLEWGVLRDTHFLLYLLATGVTYFALFPPLFFLPNYAKGMGASPNITKYILTIANAGSVVGRILPGYIGDKIGRINALLPCLAFAGVSMLVFWLPSRGDALLIVFAIVFGVSSGAFIAVGPAALGQLFGIRDLKSRLTFFLLVSAPGSLAGPAIAGCFIPTGEASGIKGYNKAIIYCAVLFFAGTAVLLALRLAISRKFFAFV